MTTPTARADVRRIVAARALRGFADGLTSIVLPAHLLALGFGATRIGAIATASLLGSAALTLAIGLVAHRAGPRVVLLGMGALMIATGIGFAMVDAFLPLLLIAFAGTLNPSGGDVSAFLPIEQSLLATRSAEADRTALYARYNLFGSFLGALGALASGLGPWAASDGAAATAAGMRAAFLVYAACGAIVVLLHLGVRVDAAEGRATGAAPRAPLARSRGVVMRLSALFALDSFGGGFVVQSLLALWLFQRFGLSLETASRVFFATSVLSALSQLGSAPLARRIGLVRTMVYTHVPANVFLALAAFAPGPELAVTLLLARMALSQMDVPARQALVMSVVPPEERAAAASVTNLPRSLAGGIAPVLAGALLARTSFGWPLLIGGVLKLVYDVWLLRAFGRLEGARAPSRD